MFLLWSLASRSVIRFRKTCSSPIILAIRFTYSQVSWYWNNKYLINQIEERRIQTNSCLSIFRSWNLTGFDRFYCNLWDLKVRQSNYIATGVYFVYDKIGRSSKNKNWTFRNQFNSINARDVGFTLKKMGKLNQISKKVNQVKLPNVNKNKEEEEENFSLLNKILTRLCSKDRL